MFVIGKQGGRKKSSSRKNSRSKRPALAPWLLAAAVVLLVAGVGALKWSRSQRGQASLLALGSDRMYADVQADVEKALRRVLPGLSAGPVGTDTGDSGLSDTDWPLPELAPGASLRCRLVDIPEGLPFREVQRRVDLALQEVGARVLWAERLFPASDAKQVLGPDEERDLLRLDVGVVGRPTHTLVLRRRGQKSGVRWGTTEPQEAWTALAARTQAPKVALVIDDWGQNRKPATRKILDLPVPLTMAVLPGLPYSREFALAKTDLVLPPGHAQGAARRQSSAEGRERRRQAGCPLEVGLIGDRSVLSRRREVLLHLPMEPQGYPDNDPGPRAIMVGMSREEIAERLDGALRGLEKVTGVNNHMGSAATSDQATMDHLMSALASRELLFLDSLTSARSVAFATAQQAGLPALKNRIFLDADHEDEEKIRRNLESLVKVARAGGFAVGIGHPHPATAQVLAREIPRLVAEGVVFVTVSEMHALQEQRREVLP